MNQLAYFITLIFLLFSLLPTQAATITVCASGCDESSIQDAIDNATAGDIIDLLDASHTEANITIDKSLTLQGQGMNATVVQAAASAGAASNRVFYVEEGITVIFQHFTIQYGNQRSGSGNATNNGGGLYLDCNANSDISFDHMLIQENRANTTGGGMYIGGGSGTVSFTDCVIRGNEANESSAVASGGGIANLGAKNFSLTRCTITGNTSGTTAGGIYILENGSVNQIINCSIYENKIGLYGGTAYGGGIYISKASSTTLINCTVVKNEIDASASPRWGAGINSVRDLSLTNCIIADNSGASSGDDVYRLGGNMSFSHSLIEDCANCNATPTYTSDPNLAAVAFCDDQAYFAILSPSDALDNGTAPVSDIPTDDICGNVRTAAHDLGSYDESATPQPIPTLGEWALIILALLMGVTATLALQARERISTVSVETGYELYLQIPKYLPFDKRQFIRMLALVLGATIGIFAVAIIAFGYELTGADAPGVVIASPIAAYLLCLWMGDK